MNIRNGTYTLLKGVEMEINGFYGHGISNPDIEKIKQISYSKKIKPLKGFRLDDKEESFVRDIRISELKNAYSVKTIGTYKGDEFWLWSYNESRNVIGLITLDSELAEKHDFLKLSDRYIKEVNPKELDSIWEERGKNEFELPIPIGIEKKKIIKPKQDKK